MSDRPQLTPGFSQPRSLQAKPEASGSPACGLHLLPKLPRETPPRATRPERTKLLQCQDKNEQALGAADTGTHLPCNRDVWGIFHSALPSVMLHFWASLGRTLCSERLVLEGKAVASASH